MTPEDRQRLEHLARHPTSLLTYEDGAALGRLLDEQAEMHTALAIIAAEHDESCACDWDSYNEHGVHESDVCDCARIFARSTLDKTGGKP